jgi:hypothetical protein
MFCNHCGKEVKDGARFCNHCGGPLGEGAVALNAPVPQMATTPSKPNRNYLVLIVAALFAVIAVAGIFYWYSNNRLSGVYVENRYQGSLVYEAYKFSGNTITAGSVTYRYGERSRSWSEFEAYKQEPLRRKGKYNITGDKIEIVWDDGFVSVWDFSRTQNTIKFNADSYRKLTKNESASTDSTGSSSSSSRTGTISEPISIPTPTPSRPSDWDVLGNYYVNFDDGFQFYYVFRINITQISSTTVSANGSILTYMPGSRSQENSFDEIYEYTRNGDKITIVVDGWTNFTAMSSSSQTKEIVISEDGVEVKTKVWVSEKLDWYWTTFEMTKDL